MPSFGPTLSSEEGAPAVFGRCAGKVYSDTGYLLALGDFIRTKEAFASILLFLR